MLVLGFENVFAKIGQVIESLACDFAFNSTIFQS